MKKKPTIFHLSHANRFLSIKIHFLFWNSVYSDRSELNVSDETIRVQNWVAEHLHRCLTWSASFFLTMRFEYFWKMFLITNTNDNREVLDGTKTLNTILICWQLMRTVWNIYIRVILCDQNNHIKHILLNKAKCILFWFSKCSTYFCIRFTRFWKKVILFNFFQVHKFYW